MTYCHSCILVFLLATTYIVNAKDAECEVCKTVLDRFSETLEGPEKSDSSAIEKKFKKFCESTKGKDERFCYYIGALKTSATYIVNEMTRPMSWGMPTEKICQKLKVKDEQICELKYDRSIDLATAKLKKMKVRDLKKILDNWGEYNACKGCTEKQEYVKIIEQLMEKHDPEAAAKRKEAKSEL